MRIVFFGSGNVASHLAPALRGAGHVISQVYSPTPSHAEELAAKVGAMPVSDLAELDITAEVYIYSVLDDVLFELISAVPVLPDAVHLHTAGSMAMDVFSGRQRHYGVLYPMQTFSKYAEVDFNTVPMFVEANDDAVRTVAMELARQVSPIVTYATTEQRGRLHVAAVFASNFTNHMYAQCEKILSDAGLPFDVMLPLIDATARKVHTMRPAEAQTGPAMRRDEKVMQRHIDLLEDDSQKRIYRLLSDSIMNLK